MIAEQQLQLTTSHQIKSIRNHHSNGLNDATTLDSTVRHSRFFRNKRKQRVNRSRPDTNGQNFH